MPHRLQLRGQPRHEAPIWVARHRIPISACPARTPDSGTEITFAKVFFAGTSVNGFLGRHDDIRPMTYFARSRLAGCHLQISSVSIPSTSGPPVPLCACEDAGSAQYRRKAPASRAGPSRNRGPAKTQATPETPEPIPLRSWRQAFPAA